MKEEIESVNEMTDIKKVVELRDCVLMLDIHNPLVDLARQKGII